MTDHQGDAGALGRSNDVTTLLDRGRDRLLDQHVNLASDAVERDGVVQVRWSGDGHRIDALGQQRLDVGERPAANQVDRALAMGLERVGDANQGDIRQGHKDAGMIASHHAGADDTDTQALFKPA